MTASLNAKALPANIARQLGEIRAEASSSVAVLDQKIRDKTAELDQVVKSVSLADAAALINADIRRSIESHRKTLMRRAAAAVSLTSHKPVKHFNVINGAGHTSATVSTPRPLSILDFDTEPLSILALLWDQKRIDTFAREAAMEAGAREGGPSVSELRTTAERLADELEVLHIERAEAKEALSSLVEVALSPLVENAFLARKPQAAENVPN